MKNERRALKLSDYTPQPVWNYALPAGWSYNANPVFYNGTVIISAVNNGTTTGGLWAIDAQTQDTRWSQSQADVLFGTPVVADGIVYVSDNSGNIWAFAADSTGQMQWQRSYQAATAPSVLGGQLIVTTQDGRIVALELDDGSVNWTYATGVSAVAAATSPILSGSVVIASVADTVYALDVATGALLWDYNVDGSLASVPSVNSNTVYFACDDGFLYALDVSSGDLNWQWPSAPLANVASASVYYNGAVYLADPEGNFYAINADTGTQLWQTGLTGKIGMLGLAIEDGIAYVMAGVDSTAVLYAVDLQSEGQEVVSYTPAGAAYLIGVETGVCYLASGVGASTNTLGVVNVAGIFHQFFCESELMVEDYVKNSGTGQAQGNSTSFRTHVALFDPNRNPRGGISVKVWASGPVTITSGGQTYDLDAASTGKTAWLQTDGAGELSIVAAASGITTPAIYLWANFMDLEEAIVIYPDHDTLNSLSTVQGSDLAQATTYDGSSLLPSSYTQADDLASTIRNTIGNTASAAQQMRSRNQQPTNRAAAVRSNTRGGVARSYIAYPESTPNMIYQAIAGATDRTYVPGAISSWQPIFDSSGRVTFSTGGTLAAQLPPGNIFDDIGDFIDNVVNGAQQVVQVIWSDVQTIVDDAQNVYKLVIKTVEDAVAVVAGVLKTVIGDIMKAIQWLSYLFDWNEYLTTKNNIKAAAQQGFSNVKTWIDNQLTSGASAVHTFFQNAESSVASDLSWVNSLIGGNSLQSQQQSQNNPQSVYGAGGGKSYTKSRWLTEKFKTNAPQGSLGDTSSPLSDIVSGVQAFYNNVVTVLEGQQFTAIPGDINEVLNDFSLLVTDPSDFVTKSFSDVISLVSDIAVTLLQFADAVLEGFLQAVQAIVDALFDLLNTPLDIPVLSDLYSMITNGSQLTILDLCCLIVSIPATIITQALSGGGATQRFGSAQGTQDGLLAGALAIYMIIDAAMNLDPETPPPMKLGYAALCLVIEGLSFPSDLASNTGASYVYWVLSICPVAFASFDFASAVGVPLAFFEEWPNVAPVVNTCYGIVMLIASILCARSSQQFVGESNEVLVQNIFDAIGYLPKPCSYFGEDGREVLTVIDGCCDLTVTGLEIALAAQAS